LINQGSTQSVDDLVAKGDELARRYFSAGRDEDDLCSEVTGARGLNASRRTPGSAPRVSLKNCYKSYTLETRSSVKEMSKRLLEMKHFLAKGQSKEFAEAYALFGKAMLANQFAFQLGVSLAGSGVSLDYTIKGTHISYHLITLTSTNVPGAFVGVQRAALDANRVGFGVPTIDLGAPLTPTAWPL
jgi:hypothetical protein